MRVHHGAPLCVLALLSLAAGRESIEVHPFPLCCFVERPPDPERPAQVTQFEEMNLAFELQAVMLLHQILEAAPRQKRGWRVHTRGGVTVLRRARGREPERTLTSIIIVKRDVWTEVTWLGRRYRWNATALETDDRLCGCDRTGEIFFERVDGGALRCWNTAGQAVGCDGISIPERDSESALDALLR